MNVLGLLAMLCSLGSLICFIIVLIKLFQNGGVVQGIIGLICGIWTFIWGWMNAGKLNIRNIMLIWTALILLSIILNVASGGFSYSFGTPPTTTP
ncbi:MAG TPA: hypothetical protein VF544_04225 [Pyrinomonadaceae bacterium]|jgi:hypothetical protein